MKIKYLSILAAAALMTAGVITSCTSSTTQSADTASMGKTEACAAKAKPCAAKADPCASKAKPCAAKTDPCAAKAKADPCASKAKPCAAKSDPCAAKKKSAGGGLAASLQGKPVVVDIYASWCPSCKNIAPTLAALRKTYGDKATFVVLDVSDKTTTAAAEKKAKELGLSEFLTANKANTGHVEIIDPATNTTLQKYDNNADKAAYTSVLDKAIAKK
jgi:thiol-disulfide isomerase/thioredoxin